MFDVCKKDYLFYMIETYKTTKSPQPLKRVEVIKRHIIYVMYNTLLRMNLNMTCNIYYV